MLDNGGLNYRAFIDLIDKRPWFIGRRRPAYRGRCGCGWSHIFETQRQAARGISRHQAEEHI